MIRTLGYYFQEQFNKLAWKDLTAGIVATQTKDVNGVIKKFPVYPVQPYSCDWSNYYDLVPNDTKKSILYCEDGGVRAVYDENRRTPSLTDFVASIKVVCWYNARRLNDFGQRVLNVMPYDVMARISEMDLKNMSPDGITLFSKVSLKFVSQDVRSVAIFQKYTYEETEKQFLMYPYDYFALNYEVCFSFDPLCIDFDPENNLNCSEKPD